MGLSAYEYEYSDVEESPEKQCEAAVQLLLENRAQILMKGLVQTGTLLRALLQKKENLLISPVMSHLSAFQCISYPKLLFAGDLAMIIAPTIEQKAEITKNAVRALHCFGIPNPKVAVLCAKESPDPKMPATMDAVRLHEMNQTGEISDCIISGAIAMDGAVSMEAAEHKGIKDPAAGDADFLLMPSIEAGNIFYKTMVYLANAQSAGVILGAKTPVVLTSRSDDAASKLNSLAMAAFISLREGEK